MLNIKKNVENSNLTFIPEEAGTYYLRIVATDQRGWTMRFYPDVIVANTHKEIHTQTFTPVMIDGNFYGQDGLYTYSLDVRKASDSEWTSLVKDSENSVMAWTPKISADYRLRITAKDAEGRTYRFFPNASVWSGMV